VSRTTAALGGVLLVATAGAVGWAWLRPRKAATAVEVPGHGGRFKSSAAARASRRAYDGAPPVIPHKDFGASCIVCHTAQGIEVQGVGFAPPMPHGDTLGLSEASRCSQCHVFRSTEARFVETSFSGLAQDLRRGERMYPGAPPRLPHGLFMREACSACHSGPAAREALRCRHPERSRCVQCHVPVLDARSSPFE
jgi:nitrate reductase (cytochrome), electron transfer subunit